MHLELHITFQEKKKKSPGKNGKEDISLTIARQKQKFRTIISIKNVKVFKFLQIKILPCLLFP